MTMIHPDDADFSYDSGYNVYGVICGTYEEACMVAGVDTPAQLRAEADYWAEQELISSLREPAFHPYCNCIAQTYALWSDTAVSPF